MDTKPKIVVEAPPGAVDLAHVETWVFDLDNTLYHPSVCDLFRHMDSRMNQFIVEMLGVDAAEANRLRQTYFKGYGTTLRGLMDVYGVEPQSFLDYVHEIDLSELTPDAKLDEALSRLPGRKIIFTNATERHAMNVLGRLGVARHFDEVFDVAAGNWLPKPQPEVYELFVRRHRVEPRRAAMFEDTARNLAPAHALGMTTIWIRTDRPNAQMAEGDDFVHHVAEDLVAWLDALGLPPGPR